MRIALRFAVVATALGVLTACDDVLLGYDGTFTGNCDRDPPLTYDNFGQAYLGKWCPGCHSSFVRENQRSGAVTGVLGTVATTSATLSDHSIQKWQELQPDEAGSWLQQNQ